MKIISLLLTYVAGLAVVCAVLFPLLPAQRVAFGERQSSVLITGEAIAVCFLAYSSEMKKRGRLNLVPCLRWLSLASVLLFVAYFQLPSIRMERYEARAHEASTVAAAYRSKHGGSVCPPLEAESNARNLELQAAEVRRSSIFAYGSPFDARVSLAGAFGAVVMAVLSARGRTPQPN